MVGWVGVFTSENFYVPKNRFFLLNFFLNTFSYYRDSDVFLADSVNLADSSDFFADILTFCHDGC